MNYSNTPGMVRVDRFKIRGKWYETMAVDMSEFYEEPNIHAALRKAIEASGHKINLVDFMYVCLEPYHQYEHPIILGLGYGGKE